MLNWIICSIRIRTVAVILNVIIVRRIMGIPGGNHADIAIDAVVVSPTVAMILLLHLYTSLKISSLERVYEQFLLESCDYFPHKGYLVMRTQQLIIVGYPVDSKWEAMQCLDFEIELSVQFIVGVYLLWLKQCF